MGFPTPDVVPFSGTKSLNKCLFKVQFLILAVQAKYQQSPLSKIAQFRQTPRQRPESHINKKIFETPFGTFLESNKNFLKALKGCECLRLFENIVASIRMAFQKNLL